jgi:hypothetical protein
MQILTDDSFLCLTSFLTPFRVVEEIGEGEKGSWSPLLQGGVLLRQREQIERLTPLTNNHQIHNSRTDPARTDPAHDPAH